MGKPDSRTADLTSELTTLGKVGAPHGIKGWVKLISFTDPPGNILDFRHFYLSAPGSGGSSARQTEPRQLIEIDESRPQGKEFVGHIKGCDDRELARQYTGKELQVEKSALPDLDEEEYYWYQLEGLQVKNLQDEDFGTVHHLIETGANDVLVVRASQDSLDDEERLIPWIWDQVIREVDLEQKLIRVDWEKDY